MALYLLLFNYDRWYDMYVENCTLKTKDEWNAEGVDNVPIGILYLTLGTFFMIIYIPFLVAMIQKDIIKYSSYKFMFMIGVFDMIAIPVDAIIPGIQTLAKQHYCTNISFYVVVGAIAHGAYLAVCISCCILAIDRFFVMLLPSLSKKVFDGRIIYLWMSIPIVYVLIYAIFNTPCLYSIKNHNYHFDPFIGTIGFEGNIAFYTHPTMILASVLEILIMGSSYTIICLVLFLKPKNYVSISKLQKVILMQSLAICFEMFFVAIVYVGNQWIPLPEFITKLEHLFLLLVHGDTPIVYLLLNGTLRKQFFKILKVYLIKGGEKCKEKAKILATSFYPGAQRIHAEHMNTTTIRTSDLTNRINLNITN